MLASFLFSFPFLFGRECLVMRNGELPMKVGASGREQSDDSDTDVMGGVKGRGESIFRYIFKCL